MRMRRIAPLLLACSVLASSLPAQSRSANRPNIIFIMSDDHAAHAISAYGSRVNRTPNIDRLAREGALLTNVFATNSICTPSRAAILTGQYSHLNGVTVFNRFDSSRTTVARLLQQGGYHTGMIGKWHLGSDPVGFDKWEILPGQGAYHDPVFYSASSETTYTGRYVTDVITERAIAFLKERPRDKPFFLMMHHKAPHRPWDPDDEHAAHFSGLRIPEPATFWDNYATRTDALHENQQRVAADLTNRDLKLPAPAGLAGAELNRWRQLKPDTVAIARDGRMVTLRGEALTRWKYQRYMQDYLATVQSVDESVGRVLQALDRNGLARNTLVIYTSDQGFFLGDHGLFDKRFMYEESIRMPFLVRWPAGITAGTKSASMALNVDFAPTFLELARLPASAGMQGHSLLRVLRGATPPDWRTSMYYRYYHDPGDHNTRAHYGVRTRTHKLIYYWKKDQWELFDLVNDPYELHNLYGEPGVEALTASLKAELTRVKREVHDDNQLADVQLPNGVDGTVASLHGKSSGSPTAPRAIVPNPGTASAGTLRDGVLTLELDALSGRWPAGAGSTPGVLVEAFAERGKAPLAPGPLMRVPAGTVVRVSLRNTLTRPITLYLPTSPATNDSVRVEPGATGALEVRATQPGNFIYRAMSDSRLSQRVGITGAMAGAMIVDSAGASGTPRDRVMVILMTPDSTLVAEMESGKTLADAKGDFAFTINGRSWPNTERIAATVGDTLRWRVVNATFDVHPMHLHGFYFRVDDFSGQFVGRDGQGAPNRMVVTERMSPFSAMSMTWTPDRAGNWLLHCHFALHLAPDAATLGDAERIGRAPMNEHGENHALTGMIGLVMGVNVAPRAGARAAVAPAPARRLRLIAVSDSGYPAMRPSFRFVIEEHGRQTVSAPGISPTLYLRRAEPVAITVVNRLHERTAVHWHGMELESYFDGVAGLSGSANRLAPIIAPGDSFVARFTPPRSGTFMYHSHVDDVRQQPAGLVGAMIVRDGTGTALPDDHEILLKGARDGPIGNNPLDIGGRANPDTIVVHAGRPARFRLMNLTAVHPNVVVVLTARPDSAFANMRDTSMVRWLPVAKDGADLPSTARTSQPALQTVSMGETYDFEIVPERRGQVLRLEVRTAGGRLGGVLLARVPVKVE